MSAYSEVSRPLGPSEPSVSADVARDLAEEVMIISDDEIPDDEIPADETPDDEIPDEDQSLAGILGGRPGQSQYYVEYSQYLQSAVLNRVRCGVIQVRSRVEWDFKIDGRFIKAPSIFDHAHAMMLMVASWGPRCAMKVGRATNCEQRWAMYVGEAWQRIVVVARLASRGEAAFLEAHLIDRFNGLGKEKLVNMKRNDRGDDYVGRGQGEGCLCQCGTHYVYIVWAPNGGDDGSWVAVAHDAFDAHRRRRL